MAYWIFQANPKVYNALAALGDPSPIDRWRVARYLNDMTPGDECALWISGRASGVYAIGVITGPVVRDRDPDLFWQDPSEGSRMDWRVGIEIEQVLEHPILRNDLKADPGFASAAIIRMPGGGNPFPVTAAEWQILESRRTPGIKPSMTVTPSWSRTLNRLEILPADGPTAEKLIDESLDVHGGD